MKYHLIIYLFLFSCISGDLYSQVKIGNNPTTIGNSSLLELESTSKGLVLPRMTGAQMNAIPSPVAGMLIFNTDSSCICQYYTTLSVWRSLCGGNNGFPVTDWHISGNAGTIDGTNFLGTTDNIPLNIRVNNQKAGRIDNLNYNAFFGYQTGNSNTGQSNSFFGHKAGYANTTGSLNTFTGDSSGYSNTTGSYNTAYGYQSLKLNTTGTLNTALGYKSLWNMTTGSDNCGVGLKALQSNTTGNNNVAVGNHAAEGNVTGGSNTSVGYATLFNNTAGGNNALLGYQVMYNSSTGSNNVGVGAYSLTSNNADNIVAVGYGAGGSNTSGTVNTYVGYQAGYLNTTGYSNHFSGYQSGYSNTTGYSNTFIGTSAGRNSITGFQNVFIGDSSGFSNSSNWNTGIGYRTLYNAAGGGSNTAIGRSALNSLTSGASNTAIGKHAMLSATTSINNVAIGADALNSNNANGNSVVGAYAMNANTAGANNTVLGYYAMSAGTTGSNNVAIGWNALNNNTTDNNTAIGSLAGSVNTSGSGNSYMGYQSGLSNTTGSFGVYIGYQAGLNNLNGHYNIAIGKGAGSTNTSGSNNLFIGNSADATAANFTNASALGYNAKVGASNSLVLGGTGADAVKVGIGTTTPSVTLNVIGDDINTGYMTVGSNTLPPSNFRMLIRNTPNVNGLLLKAGENLGDIAFRIEDDDASFNMLDVEGDQGYFVYGTTYANCLTTRGVVYGWDNQNTGSTNKDANLQNGVYRQAGIPISPYNIGGGIVNQEVSSVTATSTTSASYVLITGMSATPAAGTYMVTFSATGYHSANNVAMNVGLFKAGTLVASSARMQDAFSSNRRYQIYTQALITVNGTETIEARYNTASGTFNIAERSLILLKVSD